MAMNEKGDPMTESARRYWIPESALEPPEFKGGPTVNMVMASDYDALQQQLQQAEAELHEYKESWHKRIR